MTVVAGANTRSTWCWQPICYVNLAALATAVTSPTAVCCTYWRGVALNTVPTVAPWACPLPQLAMLGGICLLRIEFRSPCYSPEAHDHTRALRPTTSRSSSTPKCFCIHQPRPCLLGCGLARLRAAIITAALVGIAGAT